MQQFKKKIVKGNYKTSCIWVFFVVVVVNIWHYFLLDFVLFKFLNNLIGKKFLEMPLLIHYTHFATHATLTISLLLFPLHFFLSNPYTCWIILFVEMIFNGLRHISWIAKEQQIAISLLSYWMPYCYTLYIP